MRRGAASEEEGDALHSLFAELNAIQRQISALHSQSAPSGVDDPLWRAKLRALSDEKAALGRQVEQALDKVREREREAGARASLLGQATAFTQTRRRGGGGVSDGGTSDAATDGLASHLSSIGTATSALNELEDVGTSILASLSTQNETLRRAHARVIDISHTLGLSRQLIRLIERRTFFDRIFIGLGMVCTLIFMAVVYSYTRE
eukprot:CAMPEP_0170744876 /NCGR_PEP_ID=MMETSP0437-20130122/8008_1 /TAXON_ID=0 /ORGANISM="Sexangularia sp." /LENGTH=204 /DNA_ID=CAMNT_0011083587 /DNA_START=65 /DNA_END=679 /DNA_ORIENTATION=+